MNLEAPDWTYENRHQDIQDAPKDLASWIDILPYEQDKDADEYVVIPSLGIITPVNNMEESDETFDSIISGQEFNINPYLHSGVLRYPGSAQVGELGNSVILGHSSYWKADFGRYKTIFTELPEMDQGEVVWVFKKEGTEYKKYEYIIDESYETNDYDVEVLTPGNGKNLTLITCTPIGTAKNRWIVHAKLVSADIQRTYPNQTDSEYESIDKYEQLIYDWVVKQQKAHGNDVAIRKIAQLSERIEKLLAQPKYADHEQYGPILQTILETLRDV